MATADIMEKDMIKASIISYVRGLDQEGNSVIVDMVAGMQNLCYRGEVKPFDETALQNAIETGIYNHGAGLYGTGNGWHGILVVLTAGSYTIQIDLPMESNEIYWISGGPIVQWKKIMSVNV